MNRLRGLILLVSLFLSVRHAQAGSVEYQERTARMACLSGDYVKGVAILSELFVDTEDPAYIYNQGRCFEQNLRYQEAIGRFQEYLRVAKKLSKGHRTEAEKHITDCKKLLAEQPTPSPVGAPAQILTTVPAPNSTVTPAPAAPAPSATRDLAPIAASPRPMVGPPLVQQTTTPLPAQSGSGLRTAGIINLAVGGAGLVAGVIFNLKFNSVTSDMQKVDGYTPGKASDRDTYGTLTWTSYGVGVACLAGGAIFYYLGMPSGAGTSSSVALAPTLAPGQAGALLQGVF